MSTQPQEVPHGLTLPPIVTASELAAFSGWDVTTICRRARTGRLPYLRKLEGVRGPYLFDRDTVLPLLEQ